MANETQELIRAPRKISRELPVQLTDPEVANIARDIGRLNKDRQSMEAQAKLVASQWKDRIAGVEQQIADLATKAAEGTENRMVACEERFDYRLQQVEVVRLDTNTRLEVRPMTADERQPTLPGPGMEKPEKPKKGSNKEKPADKAHAEGKAEGAPAVDPDAPPADNATITEPQAVLDAEKKD